MLLSSPSISEYRSVFTTPLMAWKKKAISFLSRKAGTYVARRASDYLRRRFARRRSYTSRMPPVSRAVYNLRKGATMNNLYRVGRV